MTVNDLPVVNVIGEEKGWSLGTAPDGDIRLLFHGQLASSGSRFRYVCLLENEIIGWVYGAQRSASGDEYVAVDRIIVSPSHRGHGAARALVEQVLRDFPNEEVLMAAWDPELQSFYESLGFHEDEDGNMSKLPPHVLR